MMLMLRRILRNPLVPVFLTVLAVTLLLTLPARPAKACWNVVLQECFDQVPTSQGWIWPFQSPPNSGRTWQRNPSPPYVTWGHQRDYYDDAMCQNSIQALWCIGYPTSNDPEFDFYPANYGAYIVYGPFSLATAVEAGCTFWMFNRSEPNGDSVLWGAATSAQLTTTNIRIGGKYSGVMELNWESRTFDLANLRTMAGDSISMLGQPTVYLFWYFRSNTNTIRNIGTFIDNVSVVWDDGGLDMDAEGVSILRPDTSQVFQPQIGDSLMARCAVSTCPGGIEHYPNFRVRVTHDATTLYDSVWTNITTGSIITFYTPVWEIPSSGDHVLQLSVDPDLEVSEMNENNNLSTTSYSVQPPNPAPDFHWISPNATDTLYADATAVLRWYCSDPDETAMIRIFTDIDTTGCSGIGLAGNPHDEIDGPDSLVWNTSGLVNLRVYHIFAQVTDEVNYSCIYASQPVKICHPLEACGVSVGPQPGTIPSQYFLSQNYPNPFNPSTELQFGLTKTGHVHLRVFDILGREAAVLVNGIHSPGVYRISFDGSNLPAGLYFYSLTTAEGTLNRKMMLLK